MTTISSVASTFEIALNIEFNGNMLNNSELDNPANYTFTNDGQPSAMYARLVDVIDGYNVRLWVELFANKTSFTLTVSNNVKDSDGYSLSPNTFSFSPFQSTATMSNYNAKIRTWRESRIIREDSQRIYLAGTKGIDVFRKQTEVVPIRWAQIYDSYGIDAMFVANFPNDLEIMDTAAPFLQNQNPSPGSFAGADTSISFSVTDATTAVEITAITVYVNGLVAFMGGLGGWASGYSGQIIVGYKQLDFILIPSSNFAPDSFVFVRVVASDLLGNILSTTYSFEILSGLGFGFGEFGLMPFGNI